MLDISKLTTENAVFAATAKMTVLCDSLKLPLTAMHALKGHAFLAVVAGDS